MFGTGLADTAKKQTLDVPIIVCYDVWTMPNIDDFLETPPPELISNLQGILGAERAALERKEVVLEQLIEMITQQGGSAAEEITALRSRKWHRPTSRADQVPDSSKQRRVRLLYGAEETYKPSSPRVGIGA